MLKVTLKFELDEEQLKDLFEEYDIKFSKKKMAELKKEIKENEYSVQQDMEERFAEIIGEWIQDAFDE